MAHGDGGVWLLVERVGDEGDGGARDEFADENYSAFAGAVRLSAGNVKAEIDLFEAGVEWDGKAEDADSVEEKSDEGDVAAVLKQIEFDAEWEPRGEAGGVDCVLGHD